MNLDNFTLLVNILLAIATVISLYIAYRTVLLSKSFNDKQLSILSQPNLLLGFIPTKKTVELELAALTDIPAYDVDITIMFIYSNEDLSLKEFIRKYLNQDTSYLVHTDHDDFYYIYDKLYYHYFPGKRKVKTDLGKIPETEQYLVLLQYRDVFGRNYSQEYWFTKPMGRGSGNRLLLGGLSPIPIKESARIELDFDWVKLKSDLKEKKDSPPRLITTDNSPLPSFLTHFAEAIEHSISSGYLKGSEINDREDRGKWSDI